MTLVAGIDSSTQSCKVVIRDADDGSLIRSGRASHPDGTEIHPDRWWDALQTAIADAGGLDDVSSVAVGAQQHGMVCLDDSGAVVRDALLWNDTRSADAASALVDELGGGQAWAERVGVVPVASITATKLRWLADAEPDSADRTAAVCLPHDWLSWRLRGSDDVSTLTTDRSDASGTGYFAAATGDYDRELLRMAFRGREPLLPRVAAPPRRSATPVSVPSSLREPATTPPPHWPWTRGPATSSSPWGRRGWSRPCRERRRTTGPATSRDSPTRPVATCRWCARSTAHRCSPRPPPCSASISTASPSWRSELRPAPRVS